MYNTNYSNYGYDKTARRLYHKDVFMPNGLSDKALQYTHSFFRLSNHLLEHFNSPDIKHFITEKDLYNSMKKVETEEFKPFEIETDMKGRVTKFVVRVPYNDKTDISIVYGVRNKNDEEFHMIRTAWLNDANDTHTTLDASKYLQKMEI